MPPKSPKPMTSSERLASLETRIEVIENVASRLAETIDKIKDNHLHGLAVQMTTIESKLDQIKSCKEDINQLSEKIKINEVKVQAITDLRKFIIALAIIMIPSSANTLIDIIKNLLHLSS